jgi:hypothetical protein
VVLQGDCIIELVGEFSFGEEGMYLPMANAMQKFGSFSTLRFWDEVVSIFLGCWNWSIADWANDCLSICNYSRGLRNQFLTNFANHHELQKFWVSTSLVNKS